MRDWAKADWCFGTSAAPTVEQVTAGALQRIADALERLAVLSDPGAMEKRRNDAEEGRNLAAWRDMRWAAFKDVDKKVRTAFRTRDRRASGSLKPLAYGALKVIQSAWVHGLEYGEKSRRPPNEDEMKAMSAAVREFDPLTFDWSRVRLGAVTRGRLDAWLRHGDGDAFTNGAAGVPAEKK